MDVFLIPVGHDRYELYAEQPEQPEDASVAPPTGLIDRLKFRFDTMLRTAKQRQAAPPPAAPHGRLARLQDSMLAWVAEHVAEQHLLWTLRGTSAAVLSHPDDLGEPQALAVARRSLQDDYDRHWRWMWIDGVLFVVTFVTLAPIFIVIPGVANIPALYFGFRTISHFLSMRGARHALKGVAWTCRPCPPLGELRPLVDPAVLDRDARVTGVADRLRLPHLATFFERLTAVP